MQRIVAQSGRPIRPLVTFVQVLPSSFETCTTPSSLPAHKTPFCCGDSASAKTVQKISTPVLSPVIGPPDHCCLFLSLRVRSPLIFSQLCPPSRVRKTIWAAWYTTFGSCGEMRIGAVHWKRYFISAGVIPDGLHG